MHHNLEIRACDPWRYKMDNPIIIASVCKRDSKWTPTLDPQKFEHVLTILSKSFNSYPADIFVKKRLLITSAA